MLLPFHPTHHTRAVCSMILSHIFLGSRRAMPGCHEAATAALCLRGSGARAPEMLDACTCMAPASRLHSLRVYQTVCRSCSLEAQARSCGPRGRAAAAARRTVEVRQKKRTRRLPYSGSLVLRHLPFYIGSLVVNQKQKTFIRAPL